MENSSQRVRVRPNTRPRQPSTWKSFKTESFLPIPRPFRLLGAAFKLGLLSFLVYLSKLVTTHYFPSSSSSFMNNESSTNTSMLSASRILSQPFADNIIVSEPLKLIYCPIPKCASSNWKYLIRSLEHHPDYMDLHVAHNRNTSQLRYLSDYSPSEVKSLLSDPSFFKFAFVRNPYLRLLSCYMDKFRNTDTNYTSTEYRVFLAAAFSWKTARSIDFDQSEYGKNVPRPSFRTFVQQIVSSNIPFTSEAMEEMDAHWRPQTFLCGLGIIPYDFIGRMESLDHDVQYVLESIGHKKVQFPTHDDLKFPPSGASESLANQLYTTNLMFAVRTLYESDFEKLGYD